MSILGAAKSAVTRAITEAVKFLKDHEAVHRPLDYPPCEGDPDMKELRKYIHSRESEIVAFNANVNRHKQKLETKMSKLMEIADDDESDKSLSEYYVKSEEMIDILDSACMKTEYILADVRTQKEIVATGMQSRHRAAATVQGTDPPPTLPQQQNVVADIAQAVQLLSASSNHLPEIPLPTFSGDCWEFSRYFTGFTNLIHNNRQLNGHQKLSYLRASLKGEPLRLASTVPDSETTYEDVITILKKKYDNKDTVAAALNARIRGLSCRSPTTTASRVVLEQLQQLIPRLSEYGDTSETSRSFLTSVLDKFPDFVRRRVIEKVVDSSEDQPWKWTIVSNLLDKVIRKAELLQREDASDRHQQQRNHSQENTTPPRFNPRNNENIPSCFLCNKGPHLPSECRTVRPEDRSRVFREKKLCYRCGIQHTFNGCTKTCRKCHGPHHESLCGTHRSESNPRNNNQRSESNRDQRGDSNRDQRRDYNREQRSGPSRGQVQNNGRRDGDGPNNDRWRSQPSSGQNNSNRNQNATPVRQGTNNNVSSYIARARDENQAAMLLTGKVSVLSNESVPHDAMTLFDTGANLSFVDERMVQDCAIPIVERRQIALQVFGQKPVERTYNIATVHVKDEENNEHIVQAVCVPSNFFCDATVPQIPDIDMEQIRKANINLADKDTEDHVEKFQLLLGCDSIWKFLFKSKENSVTLHSGLMLVPSLFGYLRTGTSSGRLPAHAHTVLEPLESGRTSNSEAYWMTEALGTREFTQEITSEESIRAAINQKVEEEFVENTNFRNGRYFISFPQKEGQMEKMSRNETMSFSRLRSMYNSCGDRPWVMQQIQKNFADQEAKGMIEKIPDEELHCSHPVFYAPYQPVVSMDKENTKVRVVFDASAHERGKLSLNESLHQGPNNLPNLVGVILRARTYRYLISADVEKAFLMVGLNVQDKDLTRFVMPVNWDKPPSADNIQHYRHCVLPFGINCSPYLLSAVISLHLQNGNGREAREDLINQLYVDNAFIGTDSVFDGREKVDDAIQFFESMSMNLRQFTSNKRTLISNLPAERVSCNENTKILGVLWDVKKDKLTVKIQCEETCGQTRRIVSQIVASIFDPLGLAAPLTLKLKVFLQKLFLDDRQWDTPLEEDLQAEWEHLIHEVQGSTISIPRYVGFTRGVGAKLIIFVDASTVAYGACAYLVTRSKGHLLMSRTRLAPLRSKATVPKLELLALTMGFRVASFLLQELTRSSTVHIDPDVFVLSDSTAVLGWLQLDPSHMRAQKLGTLVYNRTKEIRDIAQSWNPQFSFLVQHVRTDQNPADHLSRGTTEPLLQVSTWINGPSFLTDHPNMWPESESRFQMEMAQQDHVEEPPEDPRQSPGAGIPVKVTQTITVLAKQDECLNWEGVGSPAHGQQSSRFTRLCKAGSYIGKFINKCLRNNEELRERVHRHVPELKKLSTSESSSVVDIEQGHNMLIRLHQSETFGKSSEKELFEVWKVRKDDSGVLRCQGRMGNSRLPLEAQRPILIQGKHSLAKLIVEHYHQKSMHAGENQTLAALRSKYWITRPRGCVRKVLRSCRTCRVFNQRPYEYPNAPDLPTRRVQCTRPFENIGLDYLGPIITKEDPKAEPLKRWILLITCLTTRAIFLDVVSEMTTSAFLQALRRFFADHGIPKSITNDNAPTFVLGDRILNQVLATTGNSVNQVQREMTENGIEWHFISAYSPWQGGCYERLCGSVKKALFKQFRRNRTPLEDLRTVLKEIAAAINQRPLTYTDTADDWALVCPANFLSKGGRVLIPEVLQPEDEDYLPPGEAAVWKTRNEVLRSLAESQKNTQEIWDNFQEQYLTNLHEANRNRNKYKCEPKPPKVGDVVLVKDLMKPRYEWPLGRIKELRPGKDGQVRNVMLTTANGREITRAVSLLIPLELTSEVETPRDPLRVASEMDQGPAQRTKRRRNARRSVPRPDYREPETDDEQQLTVHSVHGQTKHRINRLTGESVPDHASSPRSNSSSPRSNSLSWRTSTLLICMLVGMIGSARAERSSSSLCHIQCAPGGLELQCNSTDHTEVEICAEGWCSRLWITSMTTIGMPPAIVSRNYSASVKFRVPNEKVDYEELVCPAVTNFCDAISCTWCLDNIANADCHPRSVTVILIASIYLTIAATYLVCTTRCSVGVCLLTLLKLLLMPTYIAFHCFKMTWRKLARRRPDVTNRRVRRHSGYLLVPIGILCLIHVAESLRCDHVPISQSDLVQCDQEQQCLKKHEQTFYLSQMNPTGCIHAQQRDKTLLHARITWKPPVLYCVPSIVTYTRSVHHFIASSKRCAHTGSCQPDVCANMNTSSTVEELGRYNEYPGITRCTESAGFLQGGCLWPSPGCLFWRETLLPDDENVYEILKCTTWTPTAMLALDLTDQNGTKHYEVPFLPGRQKSIDGHRFTITSLQTQNVPLLSSHFATNDDKTAILPEDFALHLRCPSVQHAEGGTCSAHPQCDCHPAETKMNCVCNDKNISAIFSAIDSVLPISQPGLRVVHKEGKIRAETTAPWTLHVEWSWEIPTTVMQDADKDISCQVTFSRLEGCYGCTHGAQATAKCYSPSRTIATIVCGHIQLFTVPCSPETPQTVLDFFFDTARVNIACESSCSAEKDQPILEGLLRYSAPPHGVLTAVSWNSQERAIQLPDFGHIWSAISEYIGSKVLILLILITLFTGLGVLAFFTCPEILVFLTCLSRQRSEVKPHQL